MSPQETSELLRETLREVQERGDKLERVLERCLELNGEALPRERERIADFVERRMRELARDGQSYCAAEVRALGRIVAMEVRGDELAALLSREVRHG